MIISARRWPTAKSGWLWRSGQSADDAERHDIVLPVVLRLVNRENEEARGAENKCKIFNSSSPRQNEFIQAKRFADDCPTNAAYGVAANTVLEQIEAVRWTPADTRQAITNCGSSFGIMRRGRVYAGRRRLKPIGKAVPISPSRKPLGPDTPGLRA